jgi:hypothetical protein
MFLSLKYYFFGFGMDVFGVALFLFFFNLLSAGVPFDGLPPISSPILLPRSSPVPAIPRSLL